jgi:integrase
MTNPDVSQRDTRVNGALDLACQRAAPYVAAARADNTRLAYTRAWARWAQWCALLHVEALPAAPEAVAAYLAELASGGKAVATMQGVLAAILHGHRQHGATLDSRHPALASVMAGIARRCSRPIKRAAPLRLEDLHGVIGGIDGGDIRALRDRALLLLGFFGALRRSEIVALDVICGYAGIRGNGRSSIEVRPEGLLVHVTGSKANAATQTIGIPRRSDALCAAEALRCYLAATGIAHGPLFRPVSKSGRLLARRLDATSVRHILAQRTGSRRFTPHSLRAGFITSAAFARAPEHIIQRTSRHKSVEVLRSYIRHGDAFAGSAAGYL